MSLFVITAAEAEQGKASINADGTLSYTLPAAFTGDTITCTIEGRIVVSSRQGTVAVAVTALSIAAGEDAGEFVVDSAPGELAITVVKPAGYAGTYALKTTDLDAGPVNLVLPRVTGTAAVGAKLAALPGLWAFDADAAPLAITRQWTRAGQPIQGATGADYVVAAGDAGRTLGVVETVGSGARAVSAGFAIPAVAAGWSPAKVPGLALWLDASDSTTVTLAGTEVTEVADKSGNGRHARKVSGVLAPALAGKLNGRSLLRFPTGGVLRTANAKLPGLPGMPGVALIGVTQAHVADGYRKCVSLRNASVTAGQHLTAQTGYSIQWFGNGNRYWTKPVPGATIEMAIYRPNGTHGTTEWWRDGIKLAVTSTSKADGRVTLPADAYVQFGSDDSPSSEQGEWILILGTLSESDRQKVEGYLAHRWGLAAQLPAGHPYRTAPPA
jgi:hypothetical protein